MADNKNWFQIVWGALLTLAGIGVIFRIPQVIPRVKEIEQFSGKAIYLVYGSFYLLAIMLLIGGIRKIIENLKSTK
jgi:hypothetical protein